MSLTILCSRVLTKRLPMQWIQHRCSSVAAQAAMSAEWANARPYSEIPGPRPLPLIGNAWRFLPGIGTVPLDFFLWQKQMQQYGPISKLSGIPGKPDMVFLYDPRDFETVFRYEGQWPARMYVSSLSHYRLVERKEFFQNEGGVLAENGEKWQKSRTYVNPVMMQPRNARKYATRIDEISQEFVKKIPEMLDDKSETVDFVKEIKKWSLEAITLVALDARIGCLQSNLPVDSEADRLINAAGEMFDLLFELEFRIPFWKLISTPKWRRFVKTLDVFTEVSMRHIENAQRRLREKPNQEKTEMSVLEQLLLRDPNPKKAVVMALDMIMAGIDTTAYTAGCVLYHLARNPEQQERLHLELKQAMPSRDSPLTADILENLKFLKACIKENNRLTPIAPSITRHYTEDVVLSNYQVPKGTNLITCNLLVSSSEEYFPQSSKFLPERWLKDSSCPVAHKPHPFAMLPFGYGKRNCVGLRFATLELECLIARVRTMTTITPKHYKVVRNYLLEWHHPEMHFKCLAQYAPHGPMRIRLSPRE